MGDRAADWLKRTREKAGYRKQETLAKDIGLSRSTVANWEAGRGGPAAENVPGLAGALGVSQAEIAERFGVRLSREIETPAPPWLTQVLERLDRLQEAIGHQPAAQGELVERTVGATLAALQAEGYLQPPAERRKRSGRGAPTQAATVEARP